MTQLHMTFCHFLDNMDLTSNLFLLSYLLSEISVIVDLFRYKNINNAINFYCDKPKIEVLMHKIFIYNHIIVSSFTFDHNGNNTLRIPVSYSRLGIIVNTSCDGWEKLFTNINIKSPFQSPFSWFIVTEDVSSTFETLSDFPVEVDSDFTIITRNNDNLFSIHEVYSSGFYTKGTFHLNFLGSWNSSLFVVKQRRSNLTGVVLKGYVVITQSVVNETFEEYVERSRHSKSDTLHKLKYFTLLKYLRDMYNFSYDLRRTNSWGYMHNGSFDGMIGTLQRGEADIGCSPVLFRLERAKVVDAAMQVWRSKPLFIMRHPKHPSGYYTIFTRPLSTKVWCAIAALLVTSSALLCAMFNSRVLCRERDVDTSSSLAVLTIWSAICQQGTSENRRSTSIKIVVFVTFLFSLTIYQYYNATVVSTLLREPPKNIRTSSDLLRSNLKIGVHDVLYNKDFFNRTTDPVAIQMYRTKIVTPTEYNYFPLETGMAEVKRGGFAFLVDNTIAYGIMRATFNEKELCEAHEISLYPPENMAAIVRKGSPYKEHFTYGLRRMMESGLMHHVKSIWDEPRPACVRTPDSSLIAVSLMEFSMPLIVLACGMLTSVAVLAAELIYSSVRVRVQENTARKAKAKTINNTTAESDRKLYIPGLRDAGLSCSPGYYEHVKKAAKRVKARTTRTKVRFR